jgi:antitoxin MazE
MVYTSGIRCILFINTMLKKLLKHGNSQALIIDKAILELLGITPESEVELELEDGKLIVSRHQAKPKESRFDRLLKEIHARYGDALRELAK